MSRSDRLQALQKAVNEYINAEQQAISNQVSVLTAILKGRTGGKGLQASTNDVVTAVAQNDLASYLQGA